MKFQNPSLNFFFERTEGRTDDARTSRKQYAPYFFKVGGIKDSLPCKPSKGFLMILSQKQRMKITRFSQKPL